MITSENKGSKMNVKLKAGLEVAGFLVTAILAGATAKLGLNYLVGIYGEDTVVKGIITTAMVGVLYFMIGMLYDIRVAQLKYKEKLVEMTKK
jgi:hypothetical protein